jgi:hypothetical protein
MTTDQAIAVVSAMISLGGLFIAWVSLANQRERDRTELAERLAKLDVKVDTMWAFQVRRGYAEAVEKGFGSINSPFVPNDQARAAIAPLLEPLETFYRTEGRALSDLDLIIEIERRFGDRILKDVCIPCHIRNAACLVMAAEIVKAQTGG